MSVELSVVMPVHNAVDYLDASIASVLRQQHADFEFVILDDASTDGSTEKLEAWAERDPRIRLLKRTGTPLGLVGSSQTVTSEARGVFVARVDADDVCRSDRLARQLEVIRNEPQTALVASLYRGIDRSGDVVRPIDLSRLTRRHAIPFAHSSVMFRRDAFRRIGGYLEGTEGWEDSSLALRMSREGRIVVIADALIDYRFHLRSATAGSSDRELTSVLVDRARAFSDPRSTGRLGGQNRSFAADAYVLRAGARVWAGGRASLPVRFPPPGDASWTVRSLQSLAYASLGRLSPRLLRMLLAGMVAARNRRHRAWQGKAVEWRAGFS